MSTGKRLAKRSILGTRVCAPRADRSGLYLCGVIQASRNDAGTREENMYRVFFDEDGNIAEYPGSVLVGPGFKSVPDVVLRAGQIVYVTHNGREVRAKVSNNTPTEDVDLTVSGLGGAEPLQLKKRMEEIRLIESRKSARLQDSDTDYSRLAEGDYSSKTLPPPDQQPRRRASSLTIDVPFSTNHSGGRKRRSSADDDGVMDDCMAAMVLMSLSCSPKSSSGPHSAISLYRTWDPTLASSGCSSGASSYSSSGGSSGSTRATPSPPNHLLVVAGDSSSSPLGTGVPGSNTGTDEGIEMDDSDGDASPPANFDVTFPSSSAKRKNPLRTKVVFQCTWPNCGKQYDSCSEVEKHVRTMHLGGSPEDEQLGSGGEEEDHEEEFYYTEIEVEEGSSHHHSLLLASPSGDHSTWESPLMTMPSSIYSSSVPTLSHLDMARPAHENPEYRKQQSQVLSPNFVSTASPISIPQLHKSSSAAWHLHGYAASAPSNMGSPQKCMRLSPKPISSPSRNSLSPLHHNSSSGSRRTRSESRKCRKVYGMENRDMWCTQCKWKKACTRFVD